MQIMLKSANYYELQLLCFSRITLFGKKYEVSCLHLKKPSATIAGGYCIALSSTLANWLNG